MKYLLIVGLFSILEYSFVFCQHRRMDEITEINIRDSSFKSLVSSFIGETPESFLKGMYNNGYIYLELGCLGHKSNLLHYVFVSFISAVYLELYIGEVKINKFDKYQVPIRDFNDVKNLQIERIKVSKFYHNSDGSIKDDNYFIEKKEYLK